MADEVRINAQIQVEKGLFSFMESRAATFDQTGLGGGNPGIIEIAGGADVAVDFGDITTHGWLWMEHLSVNSNNVDFGPNNGGTILPCGTLKPGEIALFRLKDGITFRLANGGLEDERVYVALMEN